MEKRFKVINKENINGVKISIIVDNKTGVNYLMLNGLSAGGITPLLNSNGDIIIDKKI